MRALLILFLIACVASPAVAQRITADRKQNEITYDALGKCIAQKPKARVLLDKWTGQATDDTWINLDTDEVFGCMNAGTTAMRLTMPRLISVVASNL